MKAAGTEGRIGSYGAFELHSRFDNFDKVFRLSIKGAWNYSMEVGKDPQGVPKYAALRGIYDYGEPFKREAPGSQKQYGFCIPPMQPGTTVAVFEAAIDAMAEMTLCGDAADKYRLSLGGVSSSGKEPLALQEFLRQHPEITTIELRLDNDAKGRMASVGIRKIYADRYTVHDLPPDIENGDYADMAKNNLMARTAAHRAVCR